MKKSNKLKGFPPVIGRSARVMILGSMPGIESLRRRQYSGHPQNQFWKIIRTLFKPELNEIYSDKKRVLKDNHIVLWDVVHSCRRAGSLDSNLRDVQINDFEHIFKKHRSLKAVFCNGKTAYHLFKRHKGECGLPVYYLPSTSPAYTISFSRKIGEWRKILKFI